MDATDQTASRRIARRLAAIIAAVTIAAATLCGCSVENAGQSESQTGGSAQASAGQTSNASSDETDVIPSDISAMPEFSGEPAADVGDGKPNFAADEAESEDGEIGWEEYGELDNLGRCEAAEACLGPETMPPDGDERGSISNVKPTGWKQAYYDEVDGNALWNRCHLIAWSLSDEDASERNLVTGTRWMNNEGMLPYEEQVARYIDRTGNHVLYRSTPVFEGSELVCRGVRLEAESVEDGGAGVSFDVFCFNVQPGIEIDYATGESHEERAVSESGEQAYVLNTSSMKFHYPDCPAVGDMKSRNKLEVEATRDELVERGYEPCGTCRP